MKKLNMINVEEVLLAFLAASVNKNSGYVVHLLPITTQQWIEISKMASQHGVLGVIVRELDNIPKELHPEKAVLLQMLGAMYAQQRNYTAQKSVIKQITQRLAMKGIKCYVLKGISFSNYYDEPSLRPSVDFDCFLGDNYEKGNEILLQMGANNVPGDYKHTCFDYMNIFVENHHFLTDFDNTSNGIKTERLLQKRIKENPVYNTELNAWFPSDCFNALFMIKHSQHHFLNEGLTLRHLYDWAIFMNNRQKQLPWDEIDKDFHYCRMKTFAEVMTALCVRYLKLAFYSSSVNPHLEKLMNSMMYDILHLHTMPKKNNFFRILGRVSARLKRKYKYRRLDSEPFVNVLWNTVAFSSYLHRQVSLK